MLRIAPLKKVTMVWHGQPLLLAARVFGTPLHWQPTARAASATPFLRGLLWNYFHVALLPAVLIAAWACAGEDAGPPGPAGGEELPAATLMGRLPKGSLDESSGLIKSPKHAQVFWTLNDSGNPARLYAITASGKLVRAVDIPGVTNVDWEDLAADERGRLIVADFGDNQKERKEICLYRLAEPDPHNPRAGVEAVQTFRFTYPKEVGAQDAEALIVRCGYAYIFTKESHRTRAFRLPLPEVPPKEAAVAEFVAESGAITLVTGACLSPAGKHLALLTYSRVLVIELPAPLEETKADRGLPAPCVGKARTRAAFLGQAEGIAWDGDDLLISCEKAPVLFKGRELWRIEKAK